MTNDEVLKSVESRFLRYFKSDTGTLYDDLMSHNDMHDVWAAMLNILSVSKPFILEPFAKYVTTIAEQYIDSSDDKEFEEYYNATLITVSPKSVIDIFHLLYQKGIINAGEIAMSNVKNPGLEAIEHDVLPHLDSHLEGVYNGLKATGNWSETELCGLLISIKMNNYDNIEGVIRDMKKVVTALESEENRNEAFQAVLNEIAGEPVTAEAATMELVENPLAPETTVSEFEHGTGESVEALLPDENAVVDDEDGTEFPDSDDSAIEKGDLVEEDGEEFPDSDDNDIEKGNLVIEDGEEFPDSDDSAIEKGTLVIEDGEEFPDSDDSAIEKGTLVIEDGDEFPDSTDSAIEHETNEIEAGRLVIEDDTPNDFAEEAAEEEAVEGDTAAEAEDIINVEEEQESVDEDTNEIELESEEVVDEDDTPNDFEGEEESIVLNDEREEDNISNEDDGDEYPSDDTQGIVENDIHKGAEDPYNEDDFEDEDDIEDDCDAWDRPDDDYEDDVNGPELNDTSDIHKGAEDPYNEDDFEDEDDIEDDCDAWDRPDDDYEDDVNGPELNDTSDIRNVYDVPDNGFDNKRAWEEREHFAEATGMSLGDSTIDPFSASNDVNDVSFSDDIADAPFGGSNPFDSLDASFSDETSDAPFGGSNPFDSLDDPYDEKAFEHEKAVPASTLTMRGDDVSINVTTKLALGETITISISRKVDGSISTM